MATIKFEQSNYDYAMDIVSRVSYDQCVSAERIGEGRISRVLVCVSQTEFRNTDEFKQIIQQLRQMKGLVTIDTTRQGVRLNPEIHQKYEHAFVYNFEPLKSFITTADHILRLQYMIAAVNLQLAC